MALPVRAVQTTGTLRRLGSFQFEKKGRSADARATLLITPGGWPGHLPHGAPSIRNEKSTCECETHSHGHSGAVFGNGNESIPYPYPLGMTRVFERFWRDDWSHTAIVTTTVLSQRHPLQATDRPWLMVGGKCTRQFVRLHPHRPGLGGSREHAGRRNAQTGIQRVNGSLGNHGK